MLSTALLNLIASIVALAILVAVMRFAYLIAGDRWAEAEAAEALTPPYDLERAA